MNRWLITYNIPTYHLTGNGNQFVRKSFAIVCVLLDVKHLATTTKETQSNGQAGQFDKSVPTHLRHYVAERRKSRDVFVQLLTYARQSRHLLVPPLVDAYRDTRYWNMVALLLPTAMAKRLCKFCNQKSKARTGTLQVKANVNMATAQRRYKRDYDCRVRATITFQPGDLEFNYGLPHSAISVTNVTRSSLAHTIN